MITANTDTDLRKNIFETFAKEGITIFEMKKSDVTLEDAFMQLIENKEEVTENENKEIDKVEQEIKEEVKEEKTEDAEKIQEENKQEEGGQE